MERGLTLSGLSQRSGIAKSTLYLIESGQGNPTIETLWAIANALETPFGTLVEGVDTIGDSSSSAQRTGVRVRFIGRYGTSPEIEVYEMTIAAGYRRTSSAHPPGVHERVIVLSGEMLVGEAAQTVLLRSGQSHFFKADVEHSYAALNGDASAIVFVEYPGAADGVPGCTVVRDYPRTQEEWEGLRALVDLAAVEVAQGCMGFFLRLRGRDADRETLAQHLGLSKELGERWPLLAFVDEDDRGAWLALLPRIYTSAFRGDAQQPTARTPILELAIRLAAVAEQELVPLQQEAVPILESLASGSSWTLATLASEVALQHGHLMLPRQLGLRSQRLLHPMRRVADDDFASRINVDHYDAYELLHPAYARQVVALAQEILALDLQGAGGLAIDVGSGPGAALLMLLELLPDLRVIAVEPDSTAFAYLLDNTKGLSRVQCVCQNFLELDAPAEPVSVVTSVGSAHHCNTAFMLQKAWCLLSDDGILCIADELLPFFSDRDSRNTALICHHAAYILASMACVDALPIPQEETTDAHLYRQMREGLVHAVLLATHGQTSAAVKRCRDLSAMVSSTRRTKEARSVIGAFVRFYALELEAMIAGFDYEIERKTYPKRLVAMAQAAGFELVTHRRVFATSGADEWDGGTHVFAFRKCTASLHRP